MTEPAKKLEENKEPEDKGSEDKKPEDKTEQVEEEKTPEDLRAETSDKVASVYASEFQSAKSYEEKMRIIDKIHPPLHPKEAVDMLYTVSPDDDKGLIFKILEKAEEAIGPEQTVKDGKCIFETALTSADIQLAFAKKIHPDGIEEHIVPLLKHAKSDEVRETLLGKMRGKFPDEDALYEAMTTTRNSVLMKKMLDRAPGDGLSPEMVQRIKESDDIDAGLFGNIFTNWKAEKQSEESMKKSGPERMAGIAASPAGRFFSWLGGLWRRFTGGLRDFFGITPKTAAPPPEENPKEEI